MQVNVPIKIYKARMKNALAGLLIIICVAAFAGCRQETELSNISDLKAVPDGRDIVVSWAPSKDANCYYVYRANHDGDYAYWGVTERTKIRDVTVLEGEQYSYTVYPALKTKNGYVRGSVYLSSDHVPVLIKPAITSVQVSDVGCVIRWEFIEGALKYSVYKKQPGKDFAYIGDSSFNHYIDSSYEDGSVCEYVVQMSTVMNGQTFTSVLSEAVPTVSEPKIIQAAREDAYTAVITWEGIADEQKYSVYRAVAPDGEYELVGETDKPLFRDTNANFEILDQITGQLMGTADYYYKVQAYKDIERSVSYSKDSQEMALDSTAPISKFFVARYVDFVDKSQVIGNDADMIYSNEFEQDLIYLKQNGYVTVTSKEVTDYINNIAPLPEKAVMLTIDDARYGVYEYAFPLLQKYGMKAVLGVVGEYADNASKEPAMARKYCNWEEISSMAASGCFELASGSYYLNDTQDTSVDKREGVLKHPFETSEQYSKLLGDDIALLNDKLIGIDGKTPAVFVYPYSARDAETDDVLINEFGFKLLLGDDDSRKTRMNHFVDSVPPEAKLWLLNRRNRLTGTSLDKYIIAAQRFDETDSLA